MSLRKLFQWLIILIVRKFAPNLQSNFSFQPLDLVLPFSAKLRSLLLAEIFSLCKFLMAVITSPFC